jgi:hypothetical protein
MASKDVEEQGALRTVKDLTSGAVGGIAQVLLGKQVCIPEILAWDRSFFNLVFPASPCPRPPGVLEAN